MHERSQFHNARRTVAHRQLDAIDTRRRVYVVLRYRACLTEQVPAITQPCSGADAGLSPSRVQDGYRLCLEAAPPDGAGLPLVGAARPGPARRGFTVEDMVVMAQHLSFA